MIDILQTARQVQDFLDKNRWKSCLIGGLAVLRWGEPRVTRDIDVSLLTGFGTEDAYIQALLERWPARVAEAAKFASRNRVLLLRADDGTGIDVALAALPFENLAIERATDFEFEPGLTLRTCSAEDLMVLKLFASRPIDLRDADGIAVRNRNSLDWGYIAEHLAPLAEAKEAPEILGEMERLRSL